jgi:hypothetical protein
MSGYRPRRGVSEELLVASESLRIPTTITAADDKAADDGVPSWPPNRRWLFAGLSAVAGDRYRGRVASTIECLVLWIQVRRNFCVSRWKSA